MGLPVTERGGPPGGGGMGRPEELVGAEVGLGGLPMVGLVAAGRLGAEGGVGGAGRVGALGAEALGADAAGVEAAGAEGAGAEGAGAGAGGAGGTRGAGLAGAGEGGAAAGRAGTGATPGCSEAGRLVISRDPGRLVAAGAGRAGAVGGAWSSPSGAGPVDGRSGAGASARAGAAALVVAFLVAAGFLTGSSGWTGRRSPSRSALRRARSAWASSIEDEWLLTPIPRDRQRSSASLLVSPSSWASS